MRGALAFVVLVFYAGASPAAQPEWSSDWAATFTNARAEKRLVLVEVRSSNCITCDEMDAVTWRDPIVGDALQPFLLLRVDADASGSMGPYAIGAFRGLIVFDPGEQPRFRFAGYQRPEIVVQQLGRVHGVSRQLIEASEALGANDRVNAFMLLGAAYASTEQSAASVKAYATAASEAGARGDTKARLIAEIYGAMSWILDDTGDALKRLRAVEPSEIEEVEFARYVAFAVAHMRHGNRKAGQRAYLRALKHCPENAKEHCEKQAKEMMAHRMTARPPVSPPPLPQRPAADGKELRH